MTALHLSEFIADYKTILEVITEGKGADKKYYLDGIWCQSEVWNGNGRWYQREELEAERSRHNSLLIPNRKCVGELDHSEDSNIQMHRMSHIFETDLDMRENNIIGRARIIDTQYGKTLKVIIDEKIPFGVSSKGMGETASGTREGRQGTIISSYQMRTPGDVVWEQSAPDARPSAIIEKFMEMVSENDPRMNDIFDLEILDEVKKNLRTASRADLAYTKRKMFERLHHTK